MWKFFKANAYFIRTFRCSLPFHLVWERRSHPTHGVSRADKLPPIINTSKYVACNLRLSLWQFSKCLISKLNKPNYFSSLWAESQIFCNTLIPKWSQYVLQKFLLTGSVTPCNRSALSLRVHGNRSIFFINWYAAGDFAYRLKQNLGEKQDKIALVNIKNRSRTYLINDGGYNLQYFLWEDCNIFVLTTILWKFHLLD